MLICFFTLRENLSQRSVAKSITVAPVVFVKSTLQVTAIEPLYWHNQEGKQLRSTRTKILCYLFCCNDPFGLTCMHEDRNKF